SHGGAEVLQEVACVVGCEYGAFGQVGGELVTELADACVALVALQPQVEGVGGGAGVGDVAGE
ncbi:MAG: hypothetical protein IJT30_02430, partial [Muribaculaceae bacterium]|nr:hypothetical protein [Muribaculaceae bacterium]